MLKGNNFAKSIVAGMSISPRTVNLSTVNGNAIVEPWRSARQISFLIQGGDLPGTTVMVVSFQGRLRGTSTWTNLKKADGVTDMILSGSRFNDGGALENGTLVASLDLGRINSTLYDAIRINVTNTAATAAFMSVAHMLADLYSHPSTQTDETAALQTP